MNYNQPLLTSDLPNNQSPPHSPPTLYLIDGSGYIFRAFYAIARLSTSSGFPTNALFGFMRMLIKLLREKNAKYIAVAFDTNAPTFRHLRFQDYKANRKECPEELVPQLPYFRQLVEALGIRHFEKDGFEADDIIATLAKQFRGNERKIVIVSGDKDLTQLVGENVEVWDAMREVVFDEAGVSQKFGVKPTQIIDYLALTGDSSDNVPGVKGIGPKTAQLLIEHFGSIDRMLSCLKEIEQIQGLRGSSRVREQIESAAPGIRLSQELVTLDAAVEPFNQMTNIEEFAWQAVNNQLLEPLFQKLEFSGTIEGLTFVRQSSAPNIALTEQQKKYQIVSKETLPSFISQLSQTSAFAFDVETTSLDHFHCELVGISFSWASKEAYYLPLGGKADKERQLDAEEVKKLLLPIFADAQIKKVGLNLKFDINVLHQQGYQVNGVFFDSMLASYVLHPDQRQHGLKALALSCLKEPMTSYQEIVGTNEDIGCVSIDTVARYACHDAEASWCLKEVLDPLLGPKTSINAESTCATQSSLRRVFEEIEMPLVSVLSEMERVGVKVDLELLDRLDTEFSEELKGLEQSIYEKTGRQFNINSPKQLSQVLFEQLNIPTMGVKKRENHFSTDINVLQRLIGKHDVVPHLIEYRELHKLKTTYVDALKRLVIRRTGRIHTSYNQAVAATGRLSSSDPNLQNIPIRGQRGRRMREAFIAEEGYQLLSADYSQIELRVLAHLSGDKNLQQAFFAGEDIHEATARDLFGAMTFGEEERKRLRRVAKTINFGIIYGIGALRLAEQLGISRKQAQAYIEHYFERYPRVREYFSEITKKAEREGFVETLCGRRRFLKEIDASGRASGRDSGYANRSLMNFPIQGSAAEVIKVAMIRIAASLADLVIDKQFEGKGFSQGVLESKPRMVLQVHDELVFEVPNDFVELVKSFVVREMEHALPLAVPLKVDVRVSKNWGENK